LIPRCTRSEGRSGT